MNTDKIKAGLKGGLVVVAALASLAAYALTEKQEVAVTERLEPAGKVCVQGDADCGTVATVASSGPKSGEDVFNASCMACHSTGAGGAPKVGDAAAWADRIVKGNDVLYSSGINGLPGTSMMAKGGCMSCSDEEVQAAVDFMVENSQ
jgi:cytochrome c5